mgnify:CR=1 FL=1
MIFAVFMWTVVIFIVAIVLFVLWGLLLHETDKIKAVKYLSDQADKADK